MNSGAYPHRSSRVGIIDPEDWHICKLGETSLLIPKQDVVATLAFSHIVPARPGRTACGYYVLNNEVRLVYRAGGDLSPIDGLCEPHQPVIFVASGEGRVVGLVVDELDGVSITSLIEEHGLPDCMEIGNSFIQSVAITEQAQVAYVSSGDRIIDYLRTLLMRRDR